jgi:hypothetical protein
MSESKVFSPVSELPNQAPSGIVITDIREPTDDGEYKARILKHLLEAEKSTFRIELFFQRSESTKGLLQTTLFV